MNVKTYQAKTLQGALDNIKRDFGTEALILSTREVKPTGGFGFLRRPKWEVAATAPRPATVGAVTATAPAPAVKVQPPTLDQEIARRGTQPDRRIDTLLEDMDALKRSVRSLGRTLPSKGSPTGGLFGELVSQGIESEIADRLIADASEGNPSPSEVRDRVRRMLADRIVVEPSAEFQAKGRIISVFIGPTGVGKTTTIAKIAGQAAARFHKKVALVTTDMLRIGSQDQLSRFGSLLNVPAYTCSDISTLPDLIQSLDDRDLILVDTPGASPSDLARLARLEAVLKLPEARVNLVIAATTRSDDVGSILARFQRFSPKRVIFTKIDETESRSALVGDLLRNDVKITFLTNGQRVPEDLLIPSASEMSKWVLPVE